MIFDNSVYIVVWHLLLLILGNIYGEKIRYHTERLMTFETFDQRKEETWPDQQKENDKDDDNDNDKDNDKDI